MTYTYNLHHPVLSEEKAKELFNEASLMMLTKNLNERKLSEYEKEKEKINKSIVVPVEVKVNGLAVQTTAEINEITINEVYEYVRNQKDKIKPELQSYRLKVIQADKDTLKLDWRSYEFIDGTRGKKLDEGIVFIYLNGNKEVLFGEHEPFENNEKLLDYLKSVTKIFIERDYDEMDQLEIVKKVVC